MPRVSVIIATYNRAAWLPRTLRSVLAQSYGDVEVIVVDDGSTDDTMRAIGPFEREIHYIHQENAERGAARNRGLAAANGELVAFLDSDDLWRQDKLEHEVRYLDAHPAAGLVYSDASYIDDHDRVLGDVRARYYEGEALRHIVRHNFIPFGAHLVRQDVLRSVGPFNEDRTLSGSEDWELWTRVAGRANIGFTRQRSALYRLHDGGSVANPEAITRSMRRAVELIFRNPSLEARIADLRPLTEGYVELVAASLHRSAGHSREAWRHVGRACALNPRAVFDRDFARLVGGLTFGNRLSRLARRIARTTLAIRRDS